MESRPSFLVLCEQFNKLLNIELDPEIIVATNSSFTDIQPKLEAIQEKLPTNHMEGWLSKKGQDIFGLWRKRFFQLKSTSSIHEKLYLF